MVPPLAIGDVLRAFARAHAVLRAVPHDARPQAGELVGGVAAREHVERLAEHVVGELGEVRGAAHEREQLVDVPFVERGRAATICCASTSSGLRG